MKYFFIPLFSMFLSLPTYHEAFSFPFITVAQGEKQPELNFTAYDSGKTIRFTSNSGQANLFIFWGADYPETKKWSIETLKNFQAVLPFFEQRNIRLHAVDIQNTPDSVVQEVMQESSITFPSYLDIGENAFQELGVHTIPSVMYVDQKGKIMIGMGYSFRLSELVTAEISVMLNEKTNEEIQQELYPENELKNRKRAAAETYYYYGISLIDRGMPEEAAKNFKAAIATDPGFGLPYIELGCVLLEIGNACEADMYLEKGMILTPDSGKGRRCYIKLAREKKNQ